MSATYCIRNEMEHSVYGKNFKRRKAKLDTVRTISSLERG